MEKSPAADLIPELVVSDRQLMADAVKGGSLIGPVERIFLKTSVRKITSGYSSYRMKWNSNNSCFLPMVVASLVVEVFTVSAIAAKVLGWKKR